MTKGKRTVRFRSWLQGPSQISLISGTSRDLKHKMGNEELYAYVRGASSKCTHGCPGLPHPLGTRAEAM